MIHEIDLYGVFVPDLLIWMAVAFVVNFVLLSGTKSMGFILQVARNGYVVKLVIAVAIFYRPTVRIGLALSVTWSVAVWWLGEGIASLTAVLDPAVVVIGGGVSAAGDLLLGPARTAFAPSPSGARRAGGRRDR